MRRFFSLAAAGVLLLTGCAGQTDPAEETPETRQIIAMDTVVQFALYGQGAGETVQAAVEQVQELERLLPLEEEVERLRPDAQAYAQFRERIGAIECEARERAADLEEATAVQLRKTVRLFQEQYQGLMETFETAAAHVNGELRKVEVNLTQLPRALDQTGMDLAALADRIDQSGQTDRS